jgi:hypothetical protein
MGCRFSLLGLGVSPKNRFSYFSRAACGGTRRKRSFWGHPKPQQKAAALCTPASKMGGTFKGEFPKFHNIYSDQK